MAMRRDRVAEMEFRGIIGRSARAVPGAVHENDIELEHTTTTL